MDKFACFTGNEIPRVTTVNNNEHFTTGQLVDAAFQHGIDDEQQIYIWGFQDPVGWFHQNQMVKATMVPIRAIHKDKHKIMKIGSLRSFKPETKIIVPSEIWQLEIKGEPYRINSALDGWEMHGRPWIRILGTASVYGRFTLVIDDLGLEIISN